MSVALRSNQGGERLGGETSGSERKGVMQWTESELNKRKCKVRGFGGTERGIFYPCIVVVYNLKMFWSSLDEIPGVQGPFLESPGNYRARKAVLRLLC